MGEWVNELMSKWERRSHLRILPFTYSPINLFTHSRISRTIQVMAKDEGDIRATKAARAEMAKRGIDMTLADMRCMHGVLHIRGTVRPYRGNHVADMKSEMELIARV